MTQIQQVFVYGTLKKNFSNHPRLFNCNMRGGLRLPDFAMRSCGGFPAMFPAPKHSVWGEMYFIPKENLESTLRSLDMLEGFVAGRKQNHYERVIVTAPMWGDAYTYVQNPPIGNYQIVLDGIWRGCDTKLAQVSGVPEPKDMEYSWARAHSVIERNVEQGAVATVIKPPVVVIPDEPRCLSKRINGEIGPAE